MRGEVMGERRKEAEAEEGGESAGE